MATVAESVEDETVRKKLESLAGNLFQPEITYKRVSVLDLLEEFPMSTLSLGEFLDMMPPMRVRQYSISSSSLADPSVCTLTYTVVNAPAFSGHQRFYGVASNYLANREVGERMLVAVRPSRFHPPTDTKTPVIMACAGTGIAPFRGFVEERALQIKAGQTLGPALLFAGCAGPDQGVLYGDLFDEWQRIGAVDVRYAFSHEPDQSQGCKHIQDRIWHDRNDCARLFTGGGKVYLCGSGALGNEVADTMKKIYMQRAEDAGLRMTTEQATEWLNQIKQDRFISDVFA